MNRLTWLCGAAVVVSMTACGGSSSSSGQRAAGAAVGGSRLVTAWQDDGTATKLVSPDIDSIC